MVSIIFLALTMGTGHLAPRTSSFLVSMASSLSAKSEQSNAQAQRCKGAKTGNYHGFSFASWRPCVFAFFLWFSAFGRAFVFPELPLGNLLRGGFESAQVHTNDI